jgi:hypothetical protein
MSDYERAAFLYVSDLYHLKKFNPLFVKNFIFTLAERVTDRTYEDPIKIIKSTDDSIVVLAHLIFKPE